MSAQSDKRARLMELQAAVDAWATFRKKQLEDLLTSHKKIRQARGELTERAALAAEVLLAEEISEFLE
jgi:hypothetical protein